MFYWKLTEDERRLAEKVYKQKGVIFVDEEGRLHTKYGATYEGVSSEWFNSLGVFIQAIETAMLIVDVRKSNRVLN